MASFADIKGSILPWYSWPTVPCADPHFVRGGPTLTTFFFYLVDERWDDPYTTISGPSSARQRNTIRIAKKPYIFVIFQGVGGSGPPVPPLDPHISAGPLYHITTCFWDVIRLSITHTNQQWGSQCPCSVCPHIVVSYH